MKPHIKVETTAGTLASLTPEQFQSLQQNIIGEGKWETADGLKLIGGGDHLGVMPMHEGRDMMYIGIERDGYTHS